MTFTVELSDSDNHYLSSDEHYSIQNMQIRVENFPLKIDNRDQIWLNWQDRIYNEWKEACEFLSKKYNDNWNFHSIKATHFIAFCAKCFQSYIPKDCVVRGGRIRRHTNVSSGYPIYTVEIFMIKRGEEFKHPLYSGNPEALVKGYDEKLNKMRGKYIMGMNGYSFYDKDY